MTNKARTRGRAAEQRVARKTALIVGGVLAGLAAWQLYRGRPVFSTVLACSAAVLLMVAATAPRAAVRFHHVWMRTAEILGFINSRVLLAIFYVLVMTPVGWTMRMLGRDPLRRREIRRDSYWHPRPLSRQPKESFERSF